MPVIRINELTKRFGDTVVLKSVSLSFEKGKIYGFVGRNGSGKSVLLKCIAGLLIPTNGTVEVLGRTIGKDTDFAPSTGISIEQPGLLLGKSAYENLRVLSSLSQKPSRSEIEHLLHLVGLDPQEKKSTQKFSTGMKQRLSIAMALLGNPKILLLDEPMSNLDPTASNQIRNLTKQLANEGKTILLATHMKEDVVDLCETICEFKEGTVTILRQ